MREPCCQHHPHHHHHQHPHRLQLLQHQHRQKGPPHFLRRATAPSVCLVRMALVPPPPPPPPQPRTLSSSASAAAPVPSAQAHTLLHRKNSFTLGLTTTTSGFVWAISALLQISGTAQQGHSSSSGGGEQRRETWHACPPSLLVALLFSGYCTSGTTSSGVLHASSQRDEAGSSSQTHSLSLYLSESVCVSTSFSTQFC